MTKRTQKRPRAAAGEGAKAPFTGTALGPDAIAGAFMAIGQRLNGIETWIRGQPQYAPGAQPSPTSAFDTPVNREVIVNSIRGGSPTVARTGVIDRLASIRDSLRAREEHVVAFMGRMGFDDPRPSDPNTKPPDSHHIENILTDIERSIGNLDSYFGIIASRF